MTRISREGKTRILWGALVSLLSFTFLACDDDATGPDLEPDRGPEATPSIPRPVSTNDMGASQSEVFSEIRLLEGDFNPRIDRVTADWSILAERTGGTFQGLPTRLDGPCPAPVFEDRVSSDRLANAVEHSCGMVLDIGFVRLPLTAKVRAGAPLVPDALPRHVLWRDGAPSSGALSTFHRSLTRDAICTVDGGSTGLCQQTDDVTYRLRWPTIDEDVYVRRDRWWERRPLLGDDSEVFILEGPVTRSVSFSYSSGSTTENTEEFGRSLTVEVGGSFDFFSASVSATLSQTFTTRYEVRSDTTVSVTEELSGEPGVARVMTFWVLVEEFTITDSEGNAYSDPNYDIPQLSFRDEGRVTALLATDFEL